MESSCVGVIRVVKNSFASFQTMLSKFKQYFQTQCISNLEQKVVMRVSCQWSLKNNIRLIGRYKRTKNVLKDVLSESIAHEIIPEGASWRWIYDFDTNREVLLSGEGQSMLIAAGCRNHRFVPP
ncbi:hypothetical protein CEXT_204701 [Caerostris extrusa]|uniref:Uncharacterized protein n=1 Tax=Caerostris extrusa TaxID=172846 RepID=A0AAV4MQL7_CAEEX|nr:hypothetical protein CEXT_204701 [Caerostris extrusa]